MDILMGMEIHNACVVVSRYFGGTLLGTGGLVRAYGQAAKAGLEVCSIMDKVPGRKISFRCDYNGVGKIQYIAGNMGLAAIESEYAETVRLSYMVPSEDVGNLQAKVTEATAGRAGVEAGDEIYFAVTPEGIETFDN